MNTLKRRFYFRNVSQIKNSEDKTLEFQHFKEKAEKEEKKWWMLARVLLFIRMSRKTW